MSELSYRFQIQLDDYFSLQLLFGYTHFCWPNDSEYNRPFIWQNTFLLRIEVAWFMVDRGLSIVWPVFFWPDTGYLAGYCGRKQIFCHRIFNYNIIRVGPYVCPNVDMYIVCPSVRPPIFYMYELLLTYSYCTKNLRNYTFVCLFKRDFCCSI